MIETTLRKDEQDFAVCSFVHALLPPRPNRHRNMANEANYVTTTLSRLMLQRLGFRVTAADILRLLPQAGYTFFTKFGTWSPEEGRTIGVDMNSLFTQYANVPVSDKLITGENNAFVYVNVDGRLVRALRSLTIPIPANTGADKLRLIDEMRRGVEQATSAILQQLRQSPPPHSTDRAGEP